MTKIKQNNLSFNKWKLEEGTNNTIEKLFWSSEDENLSLNFTLGEFLRKIDLFHIPFFQRTYKWGKDNVNELINDIESNKFEGYFIGQVIIKDIDNTISDYQLIDGQQRITTILLMLYWLYENHSELKAEIGPLILNENGSGVVVSIVKYDNDDKIIKYNEVNQYSNIICPIMLKKFEEVYDARTLFDKLKKCILTVNKFNSTTNENKLFEKLNSTGMSLSASDLLRNFILMKLKDNTSLSKKDREKEEKKIDTFFTNTLPEALKDKNSLPYNKSEGRFFKTFTAYYTGTKVDEQKDKRIYSLIKRQFEENEEKISDFMDLLDKFIKFSEKINTLKDKKLDASSGSTILYPLHLLYKKNTMNIIPLLFALENCDVPFNNILEESSNEYYDLIEKLSLKNSIIKLSDTPYKLDSKIQLIKNRDKRSELLKHAELYSYVTSEEMSRFEEYVLSEENHYEDAVENDFRKHYKIVLCIINNILSDKEPKIEPVNYNKYTLEHIIPRKWRKNNKWDKLLSKVDGIDEYVGMCKNIVILERDTNDNKYIDEVCENLKRENTYISNELLKMLKSFRGEWNTNPIKPLKSNSSFLSAMQNFLSDEIVSKAREAIIKTNS